MISICFLTEFNFFFPIKTTDHTENHCSSSITSLLLGKENLSQPLMVNYSLKNSLSLKTWNIFRHHKRVFLIWKTDDENKKYLEQVLEKEPHTASSSSIQNLIQEHTLGYTVGQQAITESIPMRPASVGRMMSFHCQGDSQLS